MTGKQPICDLDQRISIYERSLARPSKFLAGICAPPKGPGSLGLLRLKYTFLYILETLFPRYPLYPHLLLALTESRSRVFHYKTELYLFS